MARDPGLEQLLREDLDTVQGLTQKAMFGGWAWLLDGHLLCGAGSKGILVRLGKGNDAWALGHAGVVPMSMKGRQLDGWVRARPEAFGDDLLRRKLIEAGLAFVRSLPPK